MNFTLLGLLDFEDGTDRLFLNVGNQIPTALPTSHNRVDTIWLLT